MLFRPTRALTDVDMLGLEVAIEPLDAELAPETALFVTTEGILWVDQVVIIDPCPKGRWQPLKGLSFYYLSSNSSKTRTSLKK